MLSVNYHLGTSYRHSSIVAEVFQNFLFCGLYFEILLGILSCYFDFLLDSVNCVISELCIFSEFLYFCLSPGGHFSAVSLVLPLLSVYDSVQ